MNKIIFFIFFAGTLGFSQVTHAQTKDQVFRDGIVMYNEGDYQGALKAYKHVLEMDPNYQMAYYNLGITYSAIFQWTNAISAYTKAIEIDPKYSDAYFNRSIAFRQLSLFDKALADLSKIISINPKYTRAYTNSGIIY